MAANRIIIAFYRSPVKLVVSSRKCDSGKIKSGEITFLYIFVSREIIQHFEHARYKRSGYQIKILLRVQTIIIVVEIENRSLLDKTVYSFVRIWRKLPDGLASSESPRLCWRDSEQDYAFNARVSLSLSPYTILTLIWWRTHNRYDNASRAMRVYISGRGLK